MLVIAVALGVLALFTALVALEMGLRAGAYRRMLVAEKLEKEGKLGSGGEKKAFVLLHSPTLVSEAMLQQWYDRMKEELERVWWGEDLHPEDEDMR